ncbi:MAG: hypothetical protein RIF33_23955 [Cyclobacteriaceae bacterium]
MGGLPAISSFGTKSKNWKMPKRPEAQPIIEITTAKVESFNPSLNAWSDTIRSIKKLKLIRVVKTPSFGTTPRQADIKPVRAKRAKAARLNT